MYCKACYCEVEDFYGGVPREPFKPILPGGQVMAARKVYLVARYDVTNLTGEEREHLAGYVEAQGESSGDPDSYYPDVPVALEFVEADGTVVDGLGNFAGIDQPAAADLFAEAEERYEARGTPDA